MGNSQKFIHKGGPHDGRVGKAFASVDQIERLCDSGDKAKYRRIHKRLFEFVGMRRRKGPK